jgi:hypothetical protein
VIFACWGWVAPSSAVAHRRARVGTVSPARLLLGGTGRQNSTTATGHGWLLARSDRPACRTADDGPAHTVILTHAFYMQKTMTRSTGRGAKVPGTLWSARQSGTLRRPRRRQSRWGARQSRFGRSPHPRPTLASRSARVADPARPSAGCLLASRRSIRVATISRRPSHFPIGTGAKCSTTNGAGGQQQCSDCGQTQRGWLWRGNWRTLR